ncbi:MAG: histidine--tRNA ligase [Lachnospiraceae bacterium]|nr:histidine--tRNA ligase [Lachnospiraceae bacterium]MCI9658545.1 histidine--tRNA ligase [Lachnospiraceae bacterium]
MKDMLPAEMQVRDYVTGLIKETYKSFGFSPIETPCVEHIENLCSKQGGDNEKLIFKIMKRGDKLDVKNAESESEVTDSGLRYDLTVPLSRFYANHANELPSPFKALQIGSVWRADQPQHGRFRQFVQCDIDILGEAGCLAEIELILATTTLLGRLNFSNFKVRLNERRILKAMALYSGFAEEQFDQVFIILDKMDKIGWDGVKAELTETGFDMEKVERYIHMFAELQESEDGLGYLEEKLSGILEDGVIGNLRTIRKSVESAKACEFELVFDPTLVRGMSYYTGTIFEIEMEEFSSSVAGGGRYDRMIGKFTGKDVPACGFSIGFERIITILMEQGFEIPGASVKKAYLVEKKMPAEKLTEVLKEAKAERENGVQVLVTMMNKNKKFQKEQLMKEGYEEFREFFNR